MIGRVRERSSGSLARKLCPKGQSGAPARGKGRMRNTESVDLSLFFAAFLVFDITDKKEVFAKNKKTTVLRPFWKMSRGFF